LPNALSGIAVEFFPHNKWEYVVRNHREIRNALTASSKTSTPSLEALVQLATVISGIWVDSEGSITISTITQNALLKRFLRSANSSSGTSRLRPRVKEILDAIPDFRYKIDRGYFVYSYLFSTQSLAFDCFSKKFDVVQDWIETQCPTNFSEAFENALNAWSIHD
jgi:hypothetical protein